ncbi:MAG: glycerol-3-phosphate 1-O-acyltransferase PlsY [Puniceicoccales bacterium]|jgi:glycerol-3-phosphate acyltransferase PlsY|nr:glycerol-3-phosphate 1-O-acyltransferase PlsY [Puniceicoccales bacterium]
MFYWIFLVGYFLGAVPFGFIIAKAKGIDILNTGSGSPGATNVKRTLGTKWGGLVFLLDFLKGLLPVLISKMYFRPYPNLANNVSALLLVGLILGHSYSIFLRFHGGKGVATAMGGLSILMPSATFLGVILWYSVFSITRFVSLASIGFALFLPLNAYLFAYRREIIELAFFIMIIVLLRHLPNIQRLWKGTENRFDRKSK